MILKLVIGYLILSVVCIWFGCGIGNRKIIEKAEKELDIDCTM